MRLLIILLLTGCAGTLANAKLTAAQVKHCIAVCKTFDAVVSGIDANETEVSCYCVDKYYGN